MIMRKRSFLFGALAALAMAGCSDNDLTQDGPQIADKDGKMYMKVSIADPTSGTRALGNVGNGSKEESAVKSILFVFYNQNGNYVGKSPMKWVDKTGDLADDEFGGSMPNQAPGSQVETKLTMVVPVDVNSGGFLPYYVVAYVNPANADQDAAKNLDEISALYRSADQIKDADNNFVMNNSVYYTSEGTAKPVFATVIKKLSETKDEAGKDATPMTEIYVERICARVTVDKAETLGDNLNMNAGTGIADAIDGDMTIAFHPVKWALNATAKHSYLVKQFRTNPTDAEPVSYATVNNRFTALTPTWNDLNNKRSYWCTGYAYAFDDYPRVASQAEGTDVPVNYYSYNQIEQYGFNWGASTYCLEHTVTNASAPLAAYTSVIVAGYYTLDNDAAGTFYTYGVNAANKPIVYKETEMAKLITALATASNPVMNAEGNAVTENLAGIYEVKRPADAVIGDVLVPSRYVYLQVKEAAADGTYYFRNGDGQLAQITATTLNTVNRMLMSSNPAIMYNGGKAYYNIPIEQFGKDATGKVAYGTYGIVRNHAYAINIKGISGLGTGIADPTDPIIPPTEEQTYYVRTQLNVLPWKIVNQADVTLGE